MRTIVHMNIGTAELGKYFGELYIMLEIADS